MDWNGLIAAAFVAVKLLLILVAITFFISGLDDFFIDSVYFFRSLYRRLFIYRKHEPLTVDHLLLPQEQAVAVMIPAWDESAVIGAMLENTLRSLNYGNYHLFVGVYPNDPDTQREVSRIRERFENVHLAVVPQNGPTNKADCLNRVYQEILNFEKKEKARFSVFVLHDAEDIVHPLSLKFFNYLIPRKDMIQLPVLPLEREWYQFVAGTYVDEFSEAHFKDLPVRESLSGNVPSAGVGCAFSRRALAELAAEHDNQPFSTDSLTEDYEISLRLTGLGDFKQVFAKKAVKRKIVCRSWLTGKAKECEIDEYIATREYFPAVLSAVVRQKSRWATGIALQSWARVGWKGPVSVKYMLSRDRKILWNSQVSLLGYMVLCFVFLVWLADRTGLYASPSLVKPYTWLWYLIVADTFFLVVRSLQKAYAVKRFYGWNQAFLSIPRQVWLNMINFLATSRAVYSYFRHVITKEALTWSKTDHDFPNQRQLKTFRRRLGELFLEKKFITADQLHQALAIQKAEQRPLGAILVSQGWVCENDLLQVLGTQLHLSTQTVDPYEIPLEIVAQVPTSVAVRYSVFPVAERSGGLLVLATDTFLEADKVQQLEQELERKVELVLCTRSDLTFALRRGYDRLAMEGTSEIIRLGELLLREKLINQVDLEEALRSQRQSYMRLGDILTKQGALDPKELKAALSSYSPDDHGLLGSYLVQRDFITLKQLEKALAQQKSSSKRLGDLLVERGLVNRKQLEKFFAKEALTA